MAKNPPWSRDELILALDLHFRVNPLHASEKHPEIQKLSKVLNRLPTSERVPDVEKYRNPNGVYMKLCNYLRFDPNYPGTGLTRGGKLEEAIWKEYSGKKNILSSIAEAITNAVGSEGIIPKQVEPYQDEEEEFEEGQVLTTLHKRKERNPTIVKKKKEIVLSEKGTLACEACGFEYPRKYRDLGRGFAECHHTRPLGELSKKTKTRLEDLSIICANCHRMIHRTKPLMTIEEFARLYRAKTIG